MAKISISVQAVNHKGKVRSNNEDNLYVNGTFMPKEAMDEGIQLSKEFGIGTHYFAVCDGMGGEENGEVASHALASSLDRLHQAALFENDQGIQKHIVELNQHVYDATAQKSNTRHSGGTTLASLLICGNAFRCINVGDSRVYLFRHGRLQQLTKDDTEVQRMVDFGFLKPEKVRTHPKRHVINKYMGLNPKSMLMDASISKAKKLRNGDAFLLCSDGLCDMLLDSEIADCLKRGGTAETLLNKALDAGGKDNVTVILVKITKKIW